MNLSQNQNDLFKEMVDALSKGKPITKLIKPDIPEPESDVKQVKQHNRPFPLIESINMITTFGGQAPDEFYQLRKPFVEVARLIVTQSWDADTFAFEEFSGDVALTDGIQITIGGVPILPVTINSNEDYLRYAYDVSIVPDTKPATKHTHLSARFSFGKFMGVEGRGINLIKDRLRVTVGDNLFGAGPDYGEISWTFEGWGWGT